MSIAIPTRPFASENYTGLHLPGGFFVPILGTQTLNAHVTKTTAGTENVYVESVSDPNIVVTGATHSLASVPAGGTILLQWQIDCSKASPGTHRISLIAEGPGGRRRVVKKIFVLGVEPDPANGIWRAKYPEAEMEVRFHEVLTADSSGCCGGCSDKPRKNRTRISQETHPLVFKRISDTLITHFGDTGTIPCLAIALLSKMEVSVTHTPGFEGQFSDLPFQDPSDKEVWTAVFAILCFLALLIAFIVGVVTSGAVVVVTAGAGAPAGAAGVVAITACCNPVQAVAIAVAIGAAIGAAIAGGADFPESPLRRGQLATPPGAFEKTVKERLALSLSYIEPIVPGSPYKVGANWRYERETEDAGGATALYTHAVDEVRENQHILTSYEVRHPDIVRFYNHEEFVVEARFIGRDRDGKEHVYRGRELFVQCYLEGIGELEGRVYRFALQDDGQEQDRTEDGWYRGRFKFSRRDFGQWHVTVVAQTVSQATEDMSPEEAATHLGGILLTDQLVMTTTGGTCPYTPDGDVRVI